MMKKTFTFYTPQKTGLRGLLVMLAWVCSFNLMAEDPGNTEESRRADVPVVEVAPVQRVAALLAPNAQTPPSPSSLDADQKWQAMEALVKPKPAENGQKTNPQETIVLSAAKTVSADQAILTLIQPYTVHPETGIHMRGSMPGSVGVKIQVEEGVSYLVDFLVRSAVPGSYQLDSEGESLKIEDPEGTREHVLLALNASNSGWTTVRLRRAESDFFLYSVEITQFD